MWTWTFGALLLDLLEDFAVAGFDRFGLVAAAEVVDADEEEDVARVAVEDGFVHAAEDAALVGFGQVVADDVGADAAVQHVAVGEILGDVEAFGDAVAEEDDVFLRYSPSCSARGTTSRDRSSAA